MIFHAVSRLGTVITDDYNDDEIRKELHIENIIEDFKRNFTEPLLVHIFDENNNKVKEIHT